MDTKKASWIDGNAGTVADGTQSLDEAGQSPLEQVLAFASGKNRAEEKDYREISVFKDGVVL